LSSLDVDRALVVSSAGSASADAGIRISRSTCPAACLIDPVLAVMGDQAGDGHPRIHLGSYIPRFCHPEAGPAETDAGTSIRRPKDL
jgi:hypothetical protein